MTGCAKCGAGEAVATAGPYRGLCASIECRAETRAKLRAAAGRPRPGRRLPRPETPPPAPAPAPAVEPEPRPDAPAPGSLSGLSTARPNPHPLDARLALLRDARREVDAARRHAAELTRRALDAKAEADRLAAAYAGELAKVGL